MVESGKMGMSYVLLSWQTNPKCWCIINQVSCSLIICTHQRQTAVWGPLILIQELKPPLARCWVGGGAYLMSPMGQALTVLLTSILCNHIGHIKPSGSKEVKSHTCRKKKKVDSLLPGDWLSRVTQELGHFNVTNLRWVWWHTHLQSQPQKQKDSLELEDNLSHIVSFRPPGATEQDGIFKNNKHTS